MGSLLAISRAIDRVSVAIGRAVYWLILLAILVSAGNAISRKAWSLSSNAWLELQWYLFGAAYFLAAAYTLQRNEHIRIDIVSGMMSQRARDWIDVAGHLVILMPFAGFLTYRTWWYFLDAFQSGELSASFGGLIIWPARLLMFLGFALLLVQAVSELIKRVAIIAGALPPSDAAAHQPAAEQAPR